MTSSEASDFSKVPQLQLSMTTCNSTTPIRSLAETLQRHPVLSVGIAELSFIEESDAQASRQRCATRPRITTVAALEASEVGDSDSYLISSHYQSKYVHQTQGLDEISNRKGKGRNLPKDFKASTEANQSEPCDG